MEKLKLEICCGTTCYMLGAAKLMTLENIMPAEWRDKIEVAGLPCMELCVSEKLSGAPFARLDGEVIPQATIEKILEAVRGKLKGEGS